MEIDRTENSVGKCECSRYLDGDLYRYATDNYCVKYNPIAASRAGRSTTVDTLRSKRIAAAIQANDESSEPDSADDSSDCSSSEGEESDSEDGEYSSDESSQENNEEQIQEARKRFQEEITSLVLRLTKTLRISKRKVDTMSPKVFRPSIMKLREAVDRALYVAERLTRVAISTTFTLKRVTQRAAAICDQMYIPSNLQTSASSCSLFRVKNLLKLVTRTAALLQVYTEKMAYGDFSPLDRKKMIESVTGSKDEDKNDCVLEASELSTADDEGKAQDEEMAPDTSSEDVATCKYTHPIGKGQCSTSSRCSKPNRLSISREARKAAFDKNRCKGMDMEPMSDDCDQSSDSLEEYSDDDTTSPSDKTGNDTHQDKQTAELKEKLRYQTSAFLDRLTKCLIISKKEVYAILPQLVRPSINKLREAVDNALYEADRIKLVSLHSASALKKLTHSAVTIARLVHISDSVHNTETRMSYHRLLRVRRFLNLAMQVATILHAYTEKMVSNSLGPEVSEELQMSQDSQTSVEENARSVLESRPSSNEASSSKKADIDTSQRVATGPSVFKAPSSLGICNSSSSSTLPEKCESPQKHRVINSCRQIVLDDVVDVGVVKHKESGSSQSSNYNPVVGEMINNFLRNVRRDVEEKQSIEASTLANVEKQSLFKSSCKMNRFAPYAHRKKAPSSNACVSKDKETKDVSSKLEPLSRQAKELNKAHIQEDQKQQSDICMDVLVELFERKCKISDSVNCDLSRLSFKDPGYDELSSMFSKMCFKNAREDSTQVGGESSVIKDGSLNEAVMNRRQQGRDVLVLPMKFVDGSLMDSTDGYVSEVEIETSLSSVNPEAGDLNQQVSKPLIRDSQLQLPSGGCVESETKENSSLLHDDVQVVNVGETDALVEHFETKCKISDSVNCNLSQLSFKDPGHDELSSMFSKMSFNNPDESSTQVGGESSVIKDSSLSRAVMNRRQQGRDLLVLPMKFVGGSLMASTAGNTSEFESFVDPAAGGLNQQVSKPLIRDNQLQLPSGGCVESVKENSSLICADVHVVNVGEVDALLEHFETNCKISDSVNCDLSQLSFKDPGHDELSSMFSKMSFKTPDEASMNLSRDPSVIKDSSLSGAVMNRRQQGRDVLVLPMKFVDGSLMNSTDGYVSEVEIETSSSSVDPEAGDLDQQVSKPLIRDSQLQLPSGGSVESVIKECISLICADVQMVKAGECLKSKRTKLGKRSATDANLPIPVKYMHQSS